MYSANEKRYDEMKYVRCGNSGLKLPMVSVGLWQNFGSVDVFSHSREMILGSFDMGITHFDLANNYGPVPGSAEETFGKVLADDLKKYRDELVISTKAGYHMWNGPYGDFGSKKYLVSSLDQSLKRMGLSYVDIFYHHRPDNETPLYETMDALAHIVKSGKALYAGISNYPADKTREAYEILEKMGIKLLIHQPSYSMLNRWVEDGLLDTLQEKGMGAIAFSPLAQGQLTDKYLNGIPKNSRAAGKSVFLSEKNITDGLTSKTSRLNEIAKRRGQTLAQMALMWVLREGKVTSVLIGASTLSQIKENVEIIKSPDFDSRELEEIEEILKG